MQSWKDRAGRGDPLQRRSLKTVVQPGWGKRSEAEGSCYLIKQEEEAGWDNEWRPYSHVTI